MDAGKIQRLHRISGEPASPKQHIVRNRSPVKGQRFSIQIFTSMSSRLRFPVLPFPRRAEIQ